MASTGGSNSYIANATAQRDKLSKIRQRLGFESTPQSSMRPIHPSPPEGADMDKTSAMQQAVEEDIDYDNFQLPPEKEYEMLGRIQDWIDNNNNGIDDRVEAAQGANVSPSQHVTDERTAGALAPLGAFFKERGRLPTPEELKDMQASQEIAQQLGRKPTPDEIKLFRAKPPKEVISG